MPDPVAVARMTFDAYVRSDREAIETLIADEFSFTSPLDSALDRASYFERCWPNHETITAFDFVHEAVNGDRVFVTYEGRSTSGNTFRNTEILTIRDGQVHAVEVYFGWNLPHEAPVGSSVPTDG